MASSVASMDSTRPCVADGLTCKTRPKAREFVPKIVTRSTRYIHRNTVLLTFLGIHSMRKSSDTASGRDDAATCLNFRGCCLTFVNFLDQCSLEHSSAH